MFFTDQLYNDIKKKIKKVHGGEGVKFMEQYLIKTYGLYSPEHILHTIKEEYEKVDPAKDLNWRLHLFSQVVPYLSDLLSKEEYQHLSNSDFNYIAGEMFRLSPGFFIDSLYRELRQLMNAQTRLDMDKYLIEKYSIIDGEHIIYEFRGSITFYDSQMVKPSGGISGKPPASVLLTGGSIFLTNYRIIAQGYLTTSGGANPFWGILSPILTGGTRRGDAKRAVLGSSPLYGYQFPTKNHINLKRKKKNEIWYTCIQDNQFKTIKIKVTTTEISQAKKEEQIITIFKILSKDLDHIKDTIKVLLEMVLKNRFKKHEILVLLRSLRSSKEYQRLTDSEYLDVVETTYKMNSQFFMTSIYPKMMSWEFSSFNRIKNDFVNHIENLNNETSV